MREERRERSRCGGGNEPEMEARHPRDKVHLCLSQYLPVTPCVYESITILIYWSGQSLHSPVASHDWQLGAKP